MFYFESIAAKYIANYATGNDMAFQCGGDRREKSLCIKIGVTINVEQFSNMDFASLIKERTKRNGEKCIEKIWFGNSNKLFGSDSIVF